MAEKSAAQALYPNGPQTLLGNEIVDLENLTDDQRVQYDKDHMDFRFGEDKHKEHFAKKYGLDHAVQVLDEELEKTDALRGSSGGGAAYRKELEMWRNRFQDRLNGDEERTS